jgi:hypothetical protein
VYFSSLVTFSSDEAVVDVLGAEVGVGVGVGVDVDVDVEVWAERLAHANMSAVNPIAAGKRR